MIPEFPKTKIDQIVNNDWKHVKESRYALNLFPNILYCSKILENNIYSQHYFYGSVIIIKYWNVYLKANRNA